MSQYNDAEMYVQQVSNIWSAIHEKVKQHWSWVEKSVAYEKSVKRKRDKQITNQQEIHNQCHNVNHTYYYLLN